MWMTSIVGHERLKSVVFFLSDALRSILDDGEALKTVRCAPPSIGPDASCDDIFSKLETFREDVKVMRGREAFLIAKLSRARQWAREMKTLAPALKPEINLFLLATVFCEELQQAILPSPQSAFHGGNLSKRFLEDRMKETPADGVVAPVATVAYIIAGKVRIEDLTDACERFLATLDERFSLYGEPLDDTDEADAILDLTDMIGPDNVIEDNGLSAPHVAAEQPAAASLH
jgi:hypothetical protein